MALAGNGKGFDGNEIAGIDTSIIGTVEDKAYRVVQAYVDEEDLPCPHVTFGNNAGHSGAKPFQPSGGEDHEVRFTPHDDTSDLRPV